MSTTAGGCHIGGSKCYRPGWSPHHAGREGEGLGRCGGGESAQEQRDKATRESGSIRRWSKRCCSTAREGRRLFDSKPQPRRASATIRQRWLSPTKKRTTKRLHTSRNDSGRRQLPGALCVNCRSASALAIAVSGAWCRPPASLSSCSQQQLVRRTRLLPPTPTLVPGATWTL